MFEIEKYKTFMDTVHGYVNVPCCFVEHIIDTELFQRLRNIDQTGMRILYPDAKHDRFGHSLGVFHLGTKAVDALLNNFKSDKENKWWNVTSDRTNTLFWAKNKLLFLLACLLHDIGHAPFSHALENEILHNSNDGDNSFTKVLSDELNRLENWSLLDEDNKVEILEEMDIVTDAHEQFGALLILKEFKEKIGAIYDSLITEQYPSSIVDENGLFAEHYNPQSIINKDDFNRDICFVARMILGQKYKGFEPEKQIRNCFIELLNGDFDVDKLDYIIRDTQMSGISNTSIDVERLLGAISIITKTSYNNFDGIFEAKIPYNTIQKIDNTGTTDKTTNFTGRMKGTLVFQPGVTVTIKENSEILSLYSTSNTGETILSNDIIRPNMLILKLSSFTKDSKIYKDKDGEPLPVINGNTTILVNPDDNNREHAYTCINAKVADSGVFHFKVGDNPVRVDINGFFDVKIVGGFCSESTISFFDDGKIEGFIEEMHVIGNSISKTTPNSVVYNTFSIGFKKQAINIIANVLDARNYLYLWIYAHHKVVYYANFLLPAISASLQERNLLCHELKYAELSFLEDSFVWTSIKQLRAQGKIADSKLNGLISELLSRSYKHHSVFKSLAEYDLLFESFKINEKEDVYKYLATNIDITAPFVSDGKPEPKYSAGFISQSVLESLYSKDELFKNVEELVFVSPGYKFKTTNPQKVIVRFSDERIAILDEIILLKERIVVNSSDTNHYFYLFYKTKDDIKIDGLADKFVIILKAMLDNGEIV